MWYLEIYIGLDCIECQSTSMYATILARVSQEVI